jgi:hypothetical protein
MITETEGKAAEVAAPRADAGSWTGDGSRDGSGDEEAIGRMLAWGPAKESTGSRGQAAFPAGMKPLA